MLIRLVVIIACSLSHFYIIYVKEFIHYHYSKQKEIQNITEFIDSITTGFIFNVKIEIWQPILQ